MGHDGEADVAVDPDLRERALAEGPLDHAAVSGVGEAQQFLVAVGEVVVLVVGDHLDRAAEVGMVGEVLAQQLHLLRGALFGDPAVGEVGDDVRHGEPLLALELLVGEADAVLLQEHRVVGLVRDGDGLQTALLQQGVEDPPVLVLVGAMAGDLGGERALAVRDERGDAGVLPAALGLPARGDGAEQGEGLVVVEDLREQTLGRKHREHLSAGLRGTPQRTSQMRREGCCNSCVGQLRQKEDRRCHDGGVTARAWARCSA